MKFVGFGMPYQNFNDCLCKIIEEEGNIKFYVIEAKNKDDARRKVFEEIYEQEWSNEFCEIMATLSARTSLEDYEESKLLKKYGEHDGQLIIKISCEYLDMNEKAKEECSPINEFVKQLKKSTILDLIFELYSDCIGIEKIKKNLYT